MPSSKLTLVTFVALVACGTEVTGLDDGNGGSAGANGSTTLGQQCDSNLDCGSEEYCHKEGYGCDIMFSAECRERPTSCTEEHQPVCACDEQVYDNGCLANAAGQWVASYHECAPPTSDQFSCGAWFCTVGAQYCEEVFESSHTCLPLPAGCDDVSCSSCFPDSQPLPGGNCHSCRDEGPGAVTLDCGGL